jgi:hypothetical protein
MLNLVRQASKS